MLMYLILLWGLTPIGRTCRVQVDTHSLPWYPALMSYNTVLGSSSTQPQKLSIEAKLTSRLSTLDYIGTHATQD